MNASSSAHTSPNPMQNKGERHPLKIAIIVHLFHPDVLAGASLFTDLAQYLKARGHDVRVTTPFSYYPDWKVRAEDRGLPFRDEMLDGIPIRRVRMYVPEKPTGSRRMLADMSMFWELLRRGEWTDWTPDVILTSSPMFSNCLVQRFLYRGRQIPRLIVVHDFVVDAALELKMLSLPGLKGLLLWLERWSFLSASTLITICEPMLRKLEGKLRHQRRCVFLPNWIHSSIEKEIELQAAKPVVREPARLLYSGNLGMKQGLPSFLRSFREVASQWRLRIYGGGGEAETLKAAIRETDPIQLAGVLSEPEYVTALRQATACLITQKPGIGPDFLPSKLLPALATGTPVLAVCETDSPLGQEVNEGGFGVVVPPGNNEALKQTLERWIADPSELEAMAGRSLERARLYAREAVLSRYEDELVRLGSERVDSQKPITKR